MIIKTRNTRNGSVIILGFGFDHVVLATGSSWRGDGIGRALLKPLAPTRAEVFTPDELMAGARPVAREVLLFDDDHYYMGGVLAELLAQAGCDVTLITPAPFVSDWSRNTLEQRAVHVRLVEAGVKIVLNRGVAAIHADGVETNCSYTDARDRTGCDAVVIVASRLSNDAVFVSLMAREAEWAAAGIRSVRLIGDAAAPGPIAWATYAGHRYARELDVPGIGDALPFRREITALAAD